MEVSQVITGTPSYHPFIDGLSCIYMCMHYPAIGVAILMEGNPICVVSP